MRVLIALTYFQPHKSGLTVYAVRQARALAALGHEVTVLTSQYAATLPLIEAIDGVKIVRLPVAFRLSKGVIMPSIFWQAWRYIKQADVVNLHVPQVDAALLAFMARLLAKPVVLTYHCDLRVPNGFINWLAGGAAIFANFISALLADRIVHNTRDFAEHSRFLKRFIKKLKVIPTPIIVHPVTDDDILKFKQTHAILPAQKIIGMAARLATEKGVEYLVEAMQSVMQQYPEARVIYVGEYQNVFGEEAYRQKLTAMIEKLGTHWTFTGIISEVEKSAFFHCCDVFVLPSINSTESFGMVQVEALSCGVPVVATDLPGVRQPVMQTGMGKIVPIKDAQALSNALVSVIATGKPDRLNEEIKIAYAPETVAQHYEMLFEELCSKP